MNISFKGVLATFLVFCCGGLAYGAHGAKGPPEQVSQTPASVQGTPSLQLVNPLHDFGEALEGSEVVHEFKIRNTGKGVLQIDQVRPG
jgi:hypothetical protein